ncbi:uncharacterized protein NECHADRAFT_39634 [Fusarium vanettenii 77-13-4]|uniref:Cytochrome b5 heme-binding domain-containing protein n=1 Tax=Fusarium vanettenii (strain ATCC MYA-4622 / CBS 123669 / FGSC 9596 / NRRL 45880 / 77-13-4) TaxID=660122 RepID=C7ZMF8_FUSV7|nr:uncharacterized protein NECHADRAFT_39634 [Fusarium vanettenii 77-13-4]EEU34801.1 hypothetical protein NECHADRAFT_39634 [Fusarium vanettenii 77-13-4]
MAAETKTFTINEVSQHKTRDDCYIIIRDKVYNVSKFLDEHPGGDDVIMDMAGEDTTEAFDDVGHSEEANEMLAAIFVGEISTKVSLSYACLTSWVG